MSAQTRFRIAKSSANNNMILIQDKETNYYNATFAVTKINKSFKEIDDNILEIINPHEIINIFYNKNKDNINLFKTSYNFKIANEDRIYNGLYVHKEIIQLLIITIQSIYMNQTEQNNYSHEYFMTLLSNTSVDWIDK